MWLHFRAGFSKSQIGIVLSLHLYVYLYKTWYNIIYWLVSYQTKEVAPMVESKKASSTRWKFFYFYFSCLDYKILCSTKYWNTFKTLQLTHFQSPFTTAVHVKLSLQVHFYAKVENMIFFFALETSL